MKLEAPRTPHDIPPKTMEFWRQFEGQLLDGQFKLAKYVGQDGIAAIFVSELPGQDQFVAAKVIRAASLEAEQRIASWTSAKDLQHPNLVRVFAAGAADLDGLRVVYGVVDYPDATLAQVLQARSLDPEEVRELGVNCAQALQYLHQKGFVHTSICPASIVAVDTATKLSSDFVSGSADRGQRAPQLDFPLNHYHAPELNKVGHSGPTDIWSLGITLFEALQQRIPSGDSDAEVQSLGGPLGDIIRRCLAPKAVDRWTATQVLSALRAPSSPAPSATPRVSSPVASGASAQSRSKGPRNLQAAPSGAPTSNSSGQPAVAVGEHQSAGRSMPRRKSLLATYAFSAVVVLICIGWLGKTSVETPPVQPALPPTTVAPTTQPAERPVANRPSPFEWSERAKAQRLTPPSPAASTSGSADRAKPFWRVVVYTYANAQLARNKVASINQQSPELHAELLNPSGAASHIVVVGGKLNRDQASKLRGKILAQGFPKDSYIQNFPQ